MIYLLIIYIISTLGCAFFVYKCITKSKEPFFTNNKDLWWQVSLLLIGCLFPVINTGIFIIEFIDNNNKKNV